MNPQAKQLGSDAESPAGGRSWGRFSLLVKLNLTIGISFVLTMVVFLFFFYRSERKFLIDHSTLLLRATLEALAPRIPEERLPEAGEIADLQSRLNDSGVHRHLLYIVGPTGRVLSAAEPREQGQLFTEIFPRSGDAGGRREGALVSKGNAMWLLGAKPLKTGETLFLLLDWGHIASNLRTLRTMYGLHLLDTLLLFVLLLWLVTEMFIRRPLRRLQRAIQHVEMGRWDADLETRSRDEFGWLYSRFKEMARRLKDNVDRLVRVEKYASAAIIVLRVGQDLKGPLAAVWGHLSRLSEAAHRDPAVAPIAEDLRHEWQQVEAAIRKLSEIKKPQEWGV